VTDRGPGLPRALSALGVTGTHTLLLLRGGANNRVYRVDSASGPVALKIYFRHRGDPRDRLGAETSFLAFAGSSGVRCVPRLLASDRRSGSALMEFVPGRKLRPREVTWERLEEAVEFFSALNRRRDRPEARKLPRGSESCFSLEEHLACVERRVARLGAVRGGAPVARDAVRFIRSDLLPAWQSLSHSIRIGRRPGARLLSRAERCVSPSDFGFHNAILKDDGRLCFIDFEYAGWDDPAKMACDFFCQPALPAGMRHLDRFLEGITRDFPNPEATVERVRLLLPAYQLKWCCVLLNEFLGVGKARRTFASMDCDPEERKADQLKKARVALEDLNT